MVIFHSYVSLPEGTCHRGAADWTVNCWEPWFFFLGAPCVSRPTSCRWACWHIRINLKAWRKKKQEAQGHEWWHTHTGCQSERKLCSCQGHQQHGVPVPIGSTASEALQTRCCFCGRHSTRKPCPAPCLRRGCDGVRMDAAAWHRLCRLAPQPGSSRWLGKFRQSLTMKKYKKVNHPRH